MSRSGKLENGVRFPTNPPKDAIFSLSLSWKKDERQGRIKIFCQKIPDKGGRSKNSNKGFNIGSLGKEALQRIDENSSVFQNFKKYSQELDRKHDKFEKIVKLSRDITTESKRIIFLLHTIDRESKKTSVLVEAETRLLALVSHQWQIVAKEFSNEDHYLFHKAFSPGMQEFLEAYIFFHYLKDETFPHWNFYQDKLRYKALEKPEEPLVADNSHSDVDGFVKLIPIDYILGLADVTGELMRKCINSLGEGHVEECFKTCNFVRSLYSGFLTISHSYNKEMSHKLYTLKQNLLKMEIVCYNIHVRGSEIPKHMLADLEVHKTYTEEDERFFG